MKSKQRAGPCKILVKIYLLFEHPLYEYTMLQSVTPAYTCSIALLLTALRVVFDLEPLNETVFDVKFI